MGGAGAGIYFEAAPRGRNLIPPPLSYTPQPLEGCSRIRGVGVYKNWPKELGAEKGSLKNVSFVEILENFGF